MAFCMNMYCFCVLKYNVIDFLTLCVLCAKIVKVEKEMLHWKPWNFLNVQLRVIL